MTEPTQPHDKLFKGLLDQPGTAGALLRERLPSEISGLLSDDPPELLDGEFIDEALQGSQSDRLFRACLKDGGDVLLYVLIDHKSAPEPGIILQLLEQPPIRLNRRNFADSQAVVNLRVSGRKVCGWRA